MIKLKRLSKSISSFVMNPTTDYKNGIANTHKELNNAVYSKMLKTAQTASEKVFDDVKFK